MESEPDGVGVSSPAHRFISDSDHKLQSQVILAEVIDIDDDDDDDDGSPDVMILDEMFNGKKKGKAIEEHSQHLAKESAPRYIFGPSNGSSRGSPKPILIDDSNSDMIYNHEIFDISDDITDFEYPHLQDYFDNVEFPSGVEASIPFLLDSARRRRKIENRSDSLGTRNQKNLNTLLSWTSDSAGINKNLSLTSSSSVQGALNSMNYASEAHISSRHSLLESGVITKGSSTSQLGGSSMYLTTLQKQEMRVPSNKFYEAEILFGDQPSHPGHYIPFDVNNQGGSMNPFYKSPVVTSALDHHDAVGPSMYWSTPNFADWSSNQTSDSGFYKSLSAAQNLHEKSAARTLEHVDVENFLKKYENFKRFDTVEGHSDHHYASIGSSDKPNSKNWAKKIQEEWRILENDLPDTIFVRVYESRMDLLRAAIIGAEGTPYHDGLFFFDIFFPSGYPNVPPRVYYHSGGLRLNPNLYNSGKVCLSLLGTWHGNKNENWIPGVSTVLQVLVSIQALILNKKPFFNEPLYARLSNSASGEIQSHEYNEKTFILSLKTMVYTMKKPPKHFEDFVFGHFYKHAHDILVACKAYEDGAQVGCLVKSGIQDVDEGDKSCSKSFKSSLPGCVNLLLKEFQRIGVKDMGRYQILAKLEC